MMKKLAILIFCSLFISGLNSFGQTDDGGVSIGKGNLPANPKSILELVSQTKGLLIPRMTTGQRTAIFTAADQTAVGLMVYDTNLNSFFYWLGAEWKDMGSSLNSSDFLIVSTDAPASPKANQVYFDTDTNLFYKYDNGTKTWKELDFGGGSAGSGITFPATTTAKVGSVFYHLVKQQFYVFDGENWIPLSTNGSTPTGTSLPTTAKAGDVFFVNNTTEKRLYLFDGSTWVPVGSTTLADGSVTESKLQTTGAVALTGGVNGQLLTSAGNNQFKWTNPGVLPSGTTLPSVAASGSTFYETDANILWVSNGSSWQKASGTFSIPQSASNPTGAAAGDMYYNTVDKNIYYYDGSAWVLLSGVPTGPTTPAAGTAANGDTFFNTTTNTYYIYSNGTWNPVGGLAASLAKDNFYVGNASGVATATPKDLIPLSGFAPAETNLSMNGNKITKLGSPLDPDDAATKAYVDAHSGGVGTDSQTLSISGNTLYISGGNYVTLPTSGGGSGVTSVTAGNGLTGGTITSSGTIALPTTGVNPISYTNANITVDAYGRITAASNGTSGTGGITAVSHDATLSGSGTSSDVLGIASGGVGATQLANNAVSYTKIQAASASSRLLGSSGTSTVIGEIILGTGLSMSGSTLNATGSSVTGQNVTSSGTITIGNGTGAALTAMTLDVADNSLTASKIVNQTITATKLNNVTTNGTSGQVLTSDGLGGFLWSSPGGTGNMSTTTYDPAGIAQQVVGTTAAQTLTNKTLTSPTITTPSITYTNGSIPVAAINASGTAGNTTYLRGDGTWAAPSGTGDMLKSVYDTNTDNVVDAAALATNISGGVAGAILYQSAAGTTAKTAAGTSGQVLTSNGAAAPTWTTLSALTNPMTTAGDIIIGGASGAATRLAAGTNGYVLTLSGGVPTWAAASGTGDMLKSVYDTNTDNVVDAAALATNISGGVAGAVLYQSAAGTTGKTAAGTSGQVLTSNGAAAPTWTTLSVLTNPMTTAGDIIIGGASGTPTRLAAGTTSQFLRGDGTWATPSGSGDVSSSISSSTSGQLAYFNSTTGKSITALGLGTSTTVLHGNAAGAPTWGAIALGTDVSGTLAIANGGTGATTAPAALTALGAAPLASPTFTGKVTTAASAAGSAGLNLPQGTAPTTPANGDIWTTSAGVYAYVNGATVSLGGGSSGVTSITGSTNITASSSTGAVTLSLPTTITGLTSVTATTFTGALSGNAATATSITGGVAGAVLYQSAAGTTAKTGAGANGEVLIFSGGVPTWTTVGSSGQVLTSNGTSAPSWTTLSSMTNPMTTTGDIIYASSGSTPARLAAGNSGYVLTSNGAGVAPSWQAASGGGFTTASNGLTATTATNVALGGTLSGATTITQNNNDLTFTTGASGKVVVNGDLKVDGNFILTSIRTIATDPNSTTLDLTGKDFVLNFTFAAAATSTLTLPAVGTVSAGRLLIVKNSTGKPLNIVYSAATLTTLTVGKSTMIYSDGSTWQTLGL